MGCGPILSRQWQWKETVSNTNMYAFCHCHCCQSPCEQSNLIPQNPFMKEKILPSLSVNTCNNSVAVAITQCERALRPVHTVRQQRQVFSNISICRCRHNVNTPIGHHDTHFCHCHHEWVLNPFITATTPK